MPELPEVETVAAALRQIFCGRRIIGVVCRRDRLRYPLVACELDEICTQELACIERRGKYMIWQFAGPRAVIVHLGMSGRFRCVESCVAYDTHDHVVFMLDNAHQVRYQDSRRFGFLLTVGDGDWQRHPLLASLGPEPLLQLDAIRLWRLAQHRRTPVKSFVMDQTVIAGLGNIYASEALFAAGIHPARPAGNIKKTDWQRLATSITVTLRQAVDAGGTTLRDGGFYSPAGDYGEFQVDLKVYGREGQACMVCQTPIARQGIGGRSSYFCPRCQPQRVKKTVMVVA